MILISLSIILLSGCSTWDTPESSIDSRPVIFPDYAEVTIPYNIAPLNFMVEGADHIQATFSHEGVELVRVTGKDGIIQIPDKKWPGFPQRVSVISSMFYNSFSFYRLDSF